MSIINEILTTDDVDIFREEVCEACDARKRDLTNRDIANSLKGVNFTYLKESFEGFASDLIKFNEGKKLIGAYVNCIRDNKNLTKAHTLCECIRKADKNEDVHSYIQEAMSMIGLVDKNYNKECEKLGKIVAEAYLVGSKNNDIHLPEKSRIEESVEYILSNKKNPRNLSEYNAHMKNIAEWVAENNKEVSISESKSQKAYSLIENFNKKYTNELEEDAVNFVKESFTCGKKPMFESYKTKCITKINEALKNCSGDENERLQMILEKINSKVYNPETVNADIFSLLEITKCIE